ncbi:hypothetical protein [Methylobacterium radiodurans]|uniref:hypothetical protein n=1 Tax=Methylobacterium radiodurans TaxID=2202828 RepID=UPI001FE8FDAA|nr:hypothetical protein [Methylobacterium radiodurans]
MQLNIRTFDDQVRDTVLSSVKRIVTGEASMSGAPKPPLITMFGPFPLTVNDEDATAKVAAALKRRLGDERVQPSGNAAASEDFTEFARAWDVPSVFWFVGGTDPKRYAEAEKAGTLNELPSNHSPEFAPVLNPTLRTGVETMLAAAGAWLAPTAASPRALMPLKGRTPRAQVDAPRSPWRKVAVNRSSDRAPSACRPQPIAPGRPRPMALASAERWAA